MITSNKYSPLRLGNCFIPMSSIDEQVGFSGTGPGFAPFHPSIRRARSREPRRRCCDSKLSSPCGSRQLQSPGKDGSCPFPGGPKPQHITRFRETNFPVAISKIWLLLTDVFKNRSQKSSNRRNSRKFAFLVRRAICRSPRTFQFHPATSILRTHDVSGALD